MLGVKEKAENFLSISTLKRSNFYKLVDELGKNERPLQLLSGIL
jgi:hypothetical protein